VLLSDNEALLPGISCSGLSVKHVIYNVKGVYVLKSTVSFRRAITALILSFAAISPSLSLAGGVSLGATRVIYPGMAKQTSLSITNSDQKTRYLIQSWIED